MDGERGVLQQGVEVAAVRCCGNEALEVSRMNSWKPTLTTPSTPITRAAKVSGRLRLNGTTSTDQVDKASAHSSSEPSCAPQTAANR
jgi:hypothetical protein